MGVAAADGFRPAARGVTGAGVGLNLCFGTGDADRLVALAREDPDAYLDELEAGLAADFSLHLEPADLDRLSTAVGRVAGHAERPLRPSLDVLVDTADGGLLAVADEWVEYAARADPGRAGEVAEAWFEAMRRDHGEADLSVTPEATGAVRDLLELCAAAAGRGTPVLHWWWP